MLDLKLLRQDLDAVAANLARRGFVFDRDAFTALESERKSLQVDVEAKRKMRNDADRVRKYLARFGLDWRTLQAPIAHSNQ